MAEENLDDLVVPEKKQAKGTSVLGRKPRIRFDSLSMPLFRCKRCKVRVLERDLVGHLRRCVGYGVSREKAVECYKQDGAYSYGVPEFHKPK